MSTYRKVGNTVFSLICLILCIGLFAGTLIWLLHEEGYTEYVEYGEKHYTASSENASLGILNKGVYAFNVKSLTEDTVEFSADVTPNSEKNFSFRNDGKSYKWTSIDCSSFFDICTQENSFTLTVTDNDSLTKLLHTQYSELEYSVIPDCNDIFLLTIKTLNNTINIRFGLDLGAVLSLDCDYIIF